MRTADERNPGLYLPRDRGLLPFDPSAGVGPTLPLSQNIAISCTSIALLVILTVWP